MPDKRAAPIQSPSFAAIARRMTGWTTNLLATGIIAVLALVVGRQLIVWWQVEPGGSSGPPSASAVPLASLSLSDLAAGESLELGFGQMPYQIQCRIVRGDARSAADALVAACRELAAAGSAVYPDFGDAEAGLLKLAAQATPIAHGPGDIEVFCSREGMPLVVVTSGATADRLARSAADGHPTVGPAAAAPLPAPVPGAVHSFTVDQSSGATGSLPASAEVESMQQPDTGGQAARGTPHVFQGEKMNSPAPAPPQLGAGQRRVLIWGLAAAAAEGEWNLYVAHASRGFQRTASSPEAGRSSETASPEASWQDMAPIPPGSHRSLSVWDARGGGLSAFAGSGRAEDWVAFYSAWFEQKSWIVSQPWRPAGGCWHARFERMASRGRETLDVQLGPDGAAGLVGLISIAGAEPPAGK